MDALLLLAIVAEQFAGRKKCGCPQAGKKDEPRNYMKLGLPGGERYWCEKCTDRPPEAVYLDNAVCRTKDCNNKSLYTNDGTRNNRICGECRNKLTEDEKNKYKNVVDPKCLTCEKTIPSYAIVPEGKTYRDVRPVLCKTCVGKLPKDEKSKYENVKNKRCLTCEKTIPSHAIVPEGQTFKDVQPVLCNTCVEGLTKDETQQVRKRWSPKVPHVREDST
ncbi:hypothetical protein PBCVNEJV1_178L [Paramecium bursaria Chlorella virus NE-JV-1]|nr:hypothetical protein PBCVNEJV1_178L [Paramecium bursaria Chlorella virus NE-JV-1]